MRKILFVGLLLAFLLLIPTTGLRADPVTDVFTFTGTWSGTAGSQPFAASPFELSFAAPASPTPFSPNVNLFPILVNGSYSNNGTARLFSGFDVADFQVGGGFDVLLAGLLAPQDAFAISGSSGLLFSGPTSSPTFIPGTYSLTGSAFYAPTVGRGQTTEGFSGTLTIAPVPEPASLLLLGTGLMGMAVAARKKLFG